MVESGEERCVSGHEVQIFERGGRRKLHTLLDLSEVKWARARSTKTQASVRISARACDRQGRVLTSIQARRHELVVFRGGRRVWEGPIEQVRTGPSGAYILANDVMHYLDKNPLAKAWPGPDAGGPPLMTDRVRQILQSELVTAYTMQTNAGPVVVPRWEGVDPPVNVLPYLEVRDGLVQTTSSTAAFQMTIGEHLANLVESGLDYVVVGRKIVFWDSANAIGKLGRKLTEADFSGEPEVVLDGSSFWSISHAVGQATEDPETGELLPPPVGNAGAVDPYYGVWTDLHTLEDEGGEEAPTQSALNTHAQRRQLGHDGVVPTAINMPQGVGIRLSDTVTVDHLVPGTIVPVAARFNLRTVSQDQLLEAVDVTETGASETIGVTLVPSGGVEVTAA